MTDENDKGLARAVSGALRAAIKDHGPITPERIGSATKRVIGNLRNAHFLPTEAAAALGRRGGLAGKEAGRNYSKLGARGGRAGRGVAKPRSPEALRRILARRLVRAADSDGTILAVHLQRIAPERPDLHTLMNVLGAARALGVERETRGMLPASTLAIAMAMHDVSTGAKPSAHAKGSRE